MVSELDHIFIGLSQKVGVPDDQLKFVFCLLISFPIGCIFKRINNVFLRHISGIVLGLFYQWLIYQNGVLHNVGITIVCYLLLKLIGRNSPLITFAVAMGYLLSLHLYHMITDFAGWRMTIDVVLMMNTCKWTSFAFNYKDGGRKDEELSEHQRKVRVVELPSFFEYFSYINFYATALVGPYCEYHDFIDFIHQRSDYAKIPSMIKAGLKFVFAGLLAIGIYSVFPKQFPCAWMATEEFGARNIVYKTLYLMVSLFAVRFRYYSGWMLSTANVTACGLNYDSTSEDPEDRFKKIVSVRPIDFEYINNIKDKLEAWNSSCQFWLKNYVFLRVASVDEIKKNPKKAAFASNVTFLVSAIWHGVYPGYYACFMEFFLIQQVSKFAFSNRHLFKWIPNGVGYWLAHLYSSLAINFAGLHFIELDWNIAYKASVNLYFYPLLMTIVFWILTMLPIWPRKKKGEKGEHTHSSPSKSAEESPVKDVEKTEAKKKQ